MGKTNVYRILVRKHLGMLPLKGNMIDFRVIDCEDGRWMEMVQGHCPLTGFCMSGVDP